MQPVTFATVPRYGADGQFDGVALSPFAGQVRLADASAHADAVCHIAELDAWLLPGDPEHIGKRLAALLAHWRAPDLDEDLHAIVAADWLRVMLQYPDHVVYRACEAWIEVERAKPFVSDIRRLCDEAVRTPRLHRLVLSRMVEWRPR